MSVSDYALDVPQDFIDLEPKAFAVDTRDNPVGLYDSHAPAQAEDVLSSPSLSDADSDMWSPLARKCDSLSPVSSNAELLQRCAQTPEEMKLRCEISDAQIKRSPSPCSDSPSQIVKEEGSPAEMSSYSEEPSRKSSLESATSAMTYASTASTVVENTEVNAMKKKKAAHNAIEKRYRTNMNAKFVALGSAIPSFRTRPLVNSSNVKGVRKSVRDGTQPQNKSEILTNALAYIQELQEENRLLQNEVNVLKENLLPGSMWREYHEPEAKW